jgi:DNA-binding MarR family transcriptional regulator
MSEFNEKTQTKIVFGETLGETLGETELTERQLRIYNEIKNNVSHTAKSLARQLELSQRTVEREISFLRSNGFIDKSTKENKSKWVVLK